MQFHHAARWKRSQLLQLDRAIVIFHSKTDIGIRRDRPKISRLVESAEFVFRMVLRKAAIIFRVCSALAARSEICDKLLELGHTALYFDAGQNLSRLRLNQNVYAIRHFVVVLEVRLHQNVAREPTAFHDQRRSCGELTNAFPKKARRRRVTPEDLAHCLPGVSFAWRKEQVALDVAQLIRSEQSSFQTQEEISRFLDPKTRANPQPGKRDRLADCFTQFGKPIL